MNNILQSSPGVSRRHADGAAAQGRLCARESIVPDSRFRQARHVLNEKHSSPHA
jgi:hypothetical protein